MWVLKALLLGYACAETFVATGGLQQFTIPSGVYSVEIKAWGAGGGGSIHFPGAAGGFTTGFLDVTPGEMLEVVVGAGGKHYAACDTCWDTDTGAYGGGGRGSGETGYGGGRSAIGRATSGGGGTYEEFLTAGGGGGSGTQQSGDMHAGVGGGIPAGGDSDVSPAGGEGGTDSLSRNGGGNSWATSGEALLGGTGDLGACGAGGGGGWFGGGGGAQRGGQTCASAGGGSGFLHASLASGSSSSGTLAGPPNTADPDYLAPVGEGGAVGGKGGDGLVIITFSGPLEVTVEQKAGEADPTNSLPISFIVTFSPGVVSGLTFNDFTVTGMTASTYSGSLVSLGNNQYELILATVDADGTVEVTLTNDRIDRGNSASTSVDNSVFLDRIAPSSLFTSQLAQTKETVISYTVSFSEAVSLPNTLAVSATFALAAVDVLFVSDCGAAPRCTSFQATVDLTTASGAGTVSVYVPSSTATDEAGNGNLVSSTVDVTFDNVQPSVVINQPPSQSDPSNEVQLFFTVLFSEAVFGFSESGVQTSGVTVDLVQVSGSGAEYTVSVKPAQGQYGVLTVNILAGSAQDSLGNFALASTSTDNTITFDNRPLTGVLTLHTGQTDPCNTQPVLLDLVFNKPLQAESLTATKLELSHAVVVGITDDNSQHTVFTLALSNLQSDLTLQVGLGAGAVVDEAGNTNTLVQPLSVVYDTTGPSLTISHGNLPEPSNAQPFVFFVESSEPVQLPPSAFDSTLLVSHGSSAVLSVDVQPTTLSQSFTVTLTGPLDAEGSLTGSVSPDQVNDAAGNGNTGSLPLSVGLDVIEFDTTTQVPLIVRPTSSSAVTSGFQLQATLPEPSLSESLLLIFQRTWGPADPGSPHRLSLQSLPVVMPINLDSMTSPEILNYSRADGASSGGLVVGVEYSMSLSYADALGNPRSAVVSEEVFYSPSIVDISGTQMLACCGSTNISLTGFFAGENVVLDIEVRYGPSSDPDKYLCTQTFVSRTQVVCDTEPGFGDVQFTMHLLHYQMTLVNEIVFNYPAPTIANNTLRSGLPPNPTTNLIEGSYSSGGEFVSFSGTWAAVAEDVSVFLLSSEGEIACHIDEATFNNTFLACTTDPGFGVLLPFVVEVGGSRSLPSTFVYSYPDNVPNIERVRGCMLNTTRGTTGCRTSGMNGSQPVFLTISGVNFDASVPSVRVGGKSCLVDRYTDTEIVCALPPGSGAEQLVSVSVGAFAAVPLAAVSYVGPTLLSLEAPSGEGCVRQDSMHIVSCLRSSVAPVNIVLVGTDFGQARASVRFGTHECLEVTHSQSSPHTRLTCRLPSQSGQNLPISIGQYNGLFLATDFTVSFAHCPPGTGEAPDPNDHSCVACLQGSYSNSALPGVCLPCGEGRYGPTSRRESCVQASAGFWVNGTGQSTQLPCGPGSFSGTSAQTSCSRCPAGRASNLTEATTCAACAPGRFQQAEGKSECMECATGKLSALGALQCSACPAGSAVATSNTSQQSCVSCEAGRYLDANTTVCLPCAPGSFSAPGAVACELCLAGTHQPDWEQDRCKKCPAGKFQTTKGNSTCQPCEAGTYSFLDGALVCLRCDIGRFSTGNQAQCLDCDAGKFAPASGYPACDDCLPGSFSRSRAGACTPCAAGSYSNASQAECTLCTKGYFAAAAASRCSQCDIGRFAASARAFMCEPCPVGQYASAKGASQCTPCDVGYSSGTATSGTCLPCGLGQYAVDVGSSACRDCSTGSFTNRTGSIECDDCSPGNFAAQTRSLGCSLCRPGEYGLRARASSCVQCPAGRISTVAGALECMACPAGTFVGATGQTSCEPCPPGKSSQEGQDTCFSCTGRSVAPVEGSSSCLSCDTRSSPNDQQTACVCEMYFYLAQEGALTAPKCVICPPGADCTVQGVTEASMLTLRGWWRVPNQTAYERCLVPSHCSGGALGSECGINRVGPLCSLCKPGHEKGTFGTTCYVCPPVGTSTLVACLISAAFMCLVFFVYFLVLRNTQHMLDDAFDFYGARLYNEFGSATLAHAGIMTQDPAKVVANTIKHKLPQARRPDSKRNPAVMYKFKILISFFQIGASSTFTTGVSWPSYYRAFMANFSMVFNFDFVPWESIGCATQLNYLIKATITAIMPVAFSMLIAIWFLLLYIKDRVDLSDNSTWRLLRARSRIKIWRLTMFTVFLLYPHVSASLLGVYYCITLQDVRYLANDLSIKCGSQLWNHYAMALALPSLLYPIGIPLFYFILLRRLSSQNKLSAPIEKVKHGFLFEAYTDKDWFFEIIDMLFKMGVTSLLPYLPGTMELIAVKLLLLAYLVYILLRSPYVRKGDDRLHLLMLCELLLVASMGSTINSFGPNALDSTSDVLLSIVLILVTCFSILVTFIMSLRNLRKLLRVVARRKNFLADARSRSSTIDGIDVCMLTIGSPSPARPSPSHSRSSSLNNARMRTLSNARTSGIHRSPLLGRTNLQRGLKQRARNQTKNLSLLAEEDERPERESAADLADTLVKAQLEKEGVVDQAELPGKEQLEREESEEVVVVADDDGTPTGSD